MDKLFLNSYLRYNNFTVTMFFLSRIKGFTYTELFEWFLDRQILRQIITPEFQTSYFAAAPAPATSDQTKYPPNL